MRYEPAPEMGRADVDRALLRDNPAELSVVSLSVSIHSEDAAWAESVCLRLATHADPNVRGNAVLSLGHLARIQGRLGRASVAAVEAALQDVDSYVRGQATAAADDLEHFLAWRRPG